VRSSECHKNSFHTSLKPIVTDFFNPSLGKGDEKQRYRNGGLYFISREGVGGEPAIKELQHERTGIATSQNLQRVKASVTEAKHGATNGSNECIELEEFSSDM
jgi:hypothetical protein